MFLHSLSRRSEEDCTMNIVTRDRVLRALSPMGFSARIVAAVAFAGMLMSACDVHGPSAPGTVASIAVTPNATLVAKSGQQMIAIGYDADGRVVAISPTWTVVASGGTV